jgi:hypothetical protein
MADVRLFKVIVAITDVGTTDGTLETFAAIKHQGAVWLVPKWLPHPEEGYAKPERMIRLDQFQYQRFDPPVAVGPFAGADFAVNAPLPKALFFDELSQQLKARYVVLDRPDLKFRTGGTLD